jgi:hypothetical protein
MAFAETANLAVKLTLGGNFNSQLAKTRAGLKGFDKDSSRAFKAGSQIGTGIKRASYIAAGGIAFLAANVAIGLDSLVKLESQTAQTEAVLKSTGGVAGITAKQVRNLAEKYEALNATVGDEVIQNAQNLLLTFTKVNKKAFEPALAIALDMNQALGGGPDGLAGTIKLVGKALQDPEKGLSRLGRAVGGFDDATVKAVKAALKQNDTLKAQQIIIDELTKRYGGSFARAGDTTTAKVAKFHDAIEDLQRSLAAGLLPVVSKVADRLSKLLADPKVQRSIEDLGKGIADLFSDENLDSAGRVLTDIFDAARAAAPVVAAAAKTVGALVKAAVGAFTSLPKEIQTLAIGAFAVNKLTGGLITNIAGGIFGALKVMTVQAAVVNVNGGLGGGTPGAPIGKVPPIPPPAGIVTPIIGAGIALDQQQSFDAIHRAVDKLRAKQSEDSTKIIRAVEVTGAKGEREQRNAIAKAREIAARTRDVDSSVDAGSRLSASAARDAGRHTASALKHLPVPTTNIKINVNVTPGAVQRSTTIQTRYGPPNGSSGGGKAGYTPS